LQRRLWRSTGLFWPFKRGLCADCHSARWKKSLNLKLLHIKILSCFFDLLSACLPVCCLPVCLSVCEYVLTYLPTCLSLANAYFCYWHAWPG
jgi:hypothetical protein